MMRSGRVILLQRRQDIARESDMDANDNAFEEIQDCLRQGMAICLFPEGKSHSDPGIRKFKTGAARVALEYLETNPGSNTLKIIPVGLYFRKKSAFRSGAWIGFEKAIDARQWLDTHLDANARELTDILQDQVRRLTIHFKERARSSLFMNTADLLATQGEPPVELGLRPAPRLAEQLRLVHVLQSGYAQLLKGERDRLILLENRVDKLFRTLSHNGVAPHEVFLKMHGPRAAFFVLRELELVILGLPMALWGLLNNLPAYLLVRAILKKLSLEEDQVATHAIFAGIIIFPLLYILQSLIAVFLLSPPWLLCYVISVPWCGFYAVAWLDRIRGALRRTNTWFLWRTRPDMQSELVKESSDIIMEIRRLGEQLEANNEIRT